MSQAAPTRGRPAPLVPCRAAHGGEPTADRILSAAAVLFWERGYHAVGIRELAEAVGLSTSTLYHHYRNKQQILFAVIGRFLAEFHHRMLHLLGDAALSPEQRIERTVSEHVTLTTERRQELLVGDPVLNVLSTQQRNEITRLQREYRDAFCSVIMEGVASGAFHVLDPMVSTMAILDMLDGVRSWYDPAQRLTLEALADQYRCLVLTMCGATR